jgi:carbamoyltransferase
MGLAAYAGEPPAELRAEMEGMLQVDGLEIRNEFFREHEHRSDEEQILELKRQFGNYSATEVAATLQQRTEVVLTEFAQAAIDEIGIGNVAVAGGVFANVKVNQRLYELSDVDRFFVHPDMRDSGLAVGAALRRCAELGEVLPGRLTHVYYGPTFEDVEVKQTVDRAKRASPLDVARFEETTELADSVATLLADGDVVNLFTGRVEYGPRALGNRTILYQPNDPTAIEWLNQRLKRSEFMPFAPVTMREHASECYVGYDPEACPAADFMTISFDCTDQMLERATGVVHVDGTARPQVIERETNPLYYAILEAYHERTGIPSLINTSFNMHGEPIVCTPSQALKAFRDSHTDALVLEKWLVKRS